MSSLLKLDPTGNYWETTNTKLPRPKTNFWLIKKSRRKARKKWKEFDRERREKKNVPSWSKRILLRFLAAPDELISMMSVVRDSNEWCELRGREETSSCRRRRSLRAARYYLRLIDWSPPAFNDQKTERLYFLKPFINLLIVFYYLRCN